MWFKFQIFLWYGAVTPRAQGSQEGAPLSEGPPSTSHTPAAPALPVTHIVPIAPVRSSYMSYIWLCFGMLKTTDDPPFPIYVLFLLFNLCQSATKKVRQGGGRRRGPSSGSHMGLSGTPRGPFRGPHPHPRRPRHQFAPLIPIALDGFKFYVIYQIVRFS